MSIKQLGYLVYECVPDVLDQMVTIFKDVLGTPVVNGVDGEKLIRLDGRPFRIKLRPGVTTKLAAIGWDAGSVGALEEMCGKIQQFGYPVTAESVEVAANRAARSLHSFNDRDGFHNELYVDLDFPADPALDSQFVCGDEPNGVFGLGHIVQVCSDRALTQSFYTDVMGFALSDQITWPAADIYFLHCNQRHHTVALSAEGLGLSAGMVHHIMIETKSKEAVDTAYAQLQALGFKVLMTLGEHTNDKVYSFYLFAPAGFGIELGFGGEVIANPAAWQFAHYDAPSSWGHEMVM